jgi:hypothetical protein
MLVYLDSLRSDGETGELTEIFALLSSLLDDESSGKQLGRKRR